MIYLSDINNIIKHTKHCYFSHYSKNVMYYSFYFNDDECVFPIPLKDIFPTQQLDVLIKPIKVMGFIRKAIENETITYREIE